jgi:hypothetical protein
MDKTASEFCVVIAKENLKELFEEVSQGGLFFTLI